MAKFYGEIGYGEAVEGTSGVWADDITEYTYSGDVVRNSRTLQEGQFLNNDLSVGNSISVVGDEFISQHFHRIRYIRWAGSLWTVASVEVQRPRLILRLGGLYNGEPGSPPSTP